MRPPLRGSFRELLDVHAPSLAKACGSPKPGKRDLDEWFELLRAPAVTLARIEAVRWRPAPGWSEEVGEALEPLLARLRSVHMLRLGLVSGALRFERTRAGVRDYSRFHWLLRHWGKARNRIENLDLDGVRDELRGLELDDPYAEDALTLSMLDGNQPSFAVIRRLGAERDRRLAREALSPIERAEQLHRRFAQRKNAVRRVAKLHVSSGAIVACDPQGQLDEGPFARRVAKGEYPVELLLEGSKRPTVAAARVVLGDASPVRWELALQRGQEEDDAGYPVDSALGCFTDAATLRVLTRRLGGLTGDEEDEARASFLRGLRKNRGLWLEQRPDADHPGNLVAFSTGLGDGNYLSFWGLDARRRPVVLLTDFDA